MPYQRKNKDLITISPTVDRVLYSAIQARGYSISEIINMAFSAVLELDMEEMIRFEILQKAKERLATSDYQTMIEKAREKQEEMKRAAAEEAAKKELHDTLLKIVIEKFRPDTLPRIQTLEIIVRDKRWDAAIINSLGMQIKYFFDRTEYVVSYNLAIDLIKDAVACKWTLEKDHETDSE